MEKPIEKLNNLTKKLGDFTIREAQEICVNCSDCVFCPFYGTGGALVCIFKEDDLGDVLPSELEQEIPLGRD